MSDEKKRINKAGVLSVSASTSRTQKMNRMEVVSKIQTMVDFACTPEKERKLNRGVSKETKKRWVEGKRRKSEKKSNRRISSRDFRD